MSSSDSKEEQPLRHAWSLHLDHENYFLDEPITGWVELFVRDVYMAAKIQLTLMQFVTVKVSDKTKKIGTPLLNEPLQLLTDMPRTQMCRGRHILPFKLQPDISWAKLEGDVLHELSTDESHSTLEPTPTSSQWMLPTAHWEHAEDIAVYTGTARSASVHIQYILECTSLCAVRGSVDQVVAGIEVPIAGAVDPWSFHSLTLGGDIAPSSTMPNEKIKLKAKLNRRTYKPGDAVSIQYRVINRSSCPVKAVKFSLLNSAMIRDFQSDAALPALHTASLSSHCDSIEVPPLASSQERYVSLEVPPNALPRWSAMIRKQQIKLRIETILRIALILDNSQDQIFQTTLSISSVPRARNEDKQPSKQPKVEDGRRILWVKDREAAKCANCTGVFFFLHRNHHCRGCGLIVCSNHSKSIPAPMLFGHKPRLVCKTCQELIRSGELFSGPPIKQRDQNAPKTSGSDSSTNIINDDPEAPIVRVEMEEFAMNFASIQRDFEPNHEEKAATTTTSTASTATASTSTTPTTSTATTSTTANSAIATTESTASTTDTTIMDEVK